MENKVEDTLNSGLHMHTHMYTHNSYSHIPATSCSNVPLKLKLGRFLFTEIWTLMTRSVLFGLKLRCCSMSPVWYGTWLHGQSGPLQLVGCDRVGWQVGLPSSLSLPPPVAITWCCLPWASVSWPYLCV